ncbi:hypothetical protein MHH56_04890 [Paenibacillus sp. FSL K6-3182]|uniref:hypothetical protein n=1 Tax=Paenibacillus sp. FSL K6-3182 TaxID=2921495 RepID=UPI0030CC3816
MKCTDPIVGMPSVRSNDDEVVIGEGWQIVISNKACPIILNAAKDLQDYFLTSMNLSIILRKAENFGELAKSGKQQLILGKRMSFQS